MTEEPHHAACRQRTEEEHLNLYHADTDHLELINKREEEDENTVELHDSLAVGE